MRAIRVFGPSIRKLPLCYIGSLGNLDRRHRAGLGRQDWYFIDSRIITISSSETVSPTDTSIFQTVPVISDSVLMSATVIASSSSADGRACHLFGRDCPTRRRFQKIIEESPALDLLRLRTFYDAHRFRGTFGDLIAVPRINSQITANIGHGTD